MSVVQGTTSPEAGESEWQAVLDAVDNAVLLVDAAGRVRFANRRFVEWMGLDTGPEGWGRSKDTPLHLEALVGRLSAHFQEPEQFAARWVEIHRGEEAVWDELEMREPVRRVLERFSRPLFDGAGRRSGRLEVYRDITEERQIHSKLLQTEKMAALGQLVSGIAHELNNPLTSIMGYAQLLLARPEASGAARGGRPGHPFAAAWRAQGKRRWTAEAERIFEEAQRANRIVKNLLLFARETRPERAPVQLNEAVERTLALRSYELKVKNIAVRLDLADHLPRVPADAGQLQQVVLNLLVNAEQAIESRRDTAGRDGAHGAGVRGNIRIRTAVLPSRGRGRRILLEISDDGPGIPAEIISKVFDPFFTTKPVGEGTGLGLSIVYGIVQQHGGEISARSDPGQWPWRTTFSVELPLRQGGEGAPATSGAAEPTRSFGMPAGYWPRPQDDSQPAPPADAGRVLVIEDEPTVARLIADVLAEDGHAVETVSEGQEGLGRVLGAWQTGSPGQAGKPGTAGKGYDLVICDLKMPRLDGPSFYRELERQGHPAKERMLFITGDTLSRRTLEFLEKNRLPYLAKPFLVEELRLAVNRRLEVAAPERKVARRANRTQGRASVRRKSKTVRKR